MSAAVTLALLFLLSVGLNEQVAEGCRCAPRHQQQVFCASDVVIRAKITGKVPSTHPELIAYQIKVIKIYKYFDKKINLIIHTSQTSCGIHLEKGDYLLSGNVMNGVVVVNLCDIVKPWDRVSTVEKLSLSMYPKSCVCEISPCTGASCLIKMLQKKCLIRVNDFSIDDEEALQSLCLPGSDGFCRWRKVTKLLF